jgi:hypothetical protein
MAGKSAATEVLTMPTSEPLVVAGPPHKLRGKLSLHNAGPARVMVRGGQVRSKRVRGKPQLPLHADLRPIALRPGHSRKVSLSLAVPPHTQPGEYQAELTIGTQTRPVLVHVTEQISLSISPSRLVLENRAGATAIRQVLFTNQGNVPLTIGEIGAVPLDDDLLVCRTLRAALKSLDEKLAQESGRPQTSDYLGEVALQAKEVLDRAGALRVHNQEGAVALAPGESRLITLEIRVPDTLERRSRYRGQAAVYDADLSFVIVPITAQPEQSAGVK